MTSFKYTTLTVLGSLLIAGAVTGCSNPDATPAAQDQTENKGPNTGQTDSSTTDQKNASEQSDLADLRQYSSDPNKSDMNADFNVVGTFVSQNEDNLTIKVSGNEVVIPKKSSFEKGDSLPDNMDGQEISVKIDNQSQSAVSAELAKAANDEDNTTKDPIGTYVSEDTKTVMIKKGEKEVSYNKAADFEENVEAGAADMTGKTVQLELDAEGNVKRVSLQYQDTSSG
ncbi:hypothetical protein PO903_08185 [Paenibacillus sp. PK4536]|uniref:Lipoprotein n=1 Tax=Paenibacillus nuruki TaxID=1886670 RepID=A0A1E3KXM6_9BACL|nr:MULTISPECIES: hypothetical protein [Paenibacillus]ODP26287.1 hypothetical protein PTI45_04127 [Paenibacillus nuruki]WIM40841.1 hypothetical protein PO903_08185 [Paenibacillus sp. PK4536]CAJ1316809.1 Lipoprotein [Paenibacillus nuruki]